MPPETPPTALVSRALVNPVVDQRENNIAPHKPAFRRPAGVSLHHLLIAQLDVTQTEYSTAELARLCGISNDSMARRIRQRFPRETGEKRVEHRLDFCHAVLLIRWVCQDGRKLPDLDQLFCDLVTAKVIDLSFPASNVAVRMAERVFAQERQRVLDLAVKRAA